MNVPVLEIGGSHLTAALVSPTGPEVLRLRRWHVEPDASAEDFMKVMLEGADWLAVEPGAAWGVAMPGPFDYRSGVGRFVGVGKFEALNGFDVGTAFTERAPARPGRVVFLNDADSFGLGEYTVGAAKGFRRAICLTLGTGVGSAFVADGVPLSSGPGVPPEGEAHFIVWGGQELEETVSRRAIRRAYREQTGADLDVHEIAELARSGSEVAGAVLEHAFQALGEAMSGYVRDFGAEVLVLGGSIAGSFDLIEPPLRKGLARDVVIRVAGDPENAPLIGAAVHATSS
ncbi:ROK family protein [Kineosporia rhizophila]|uniref:ROK family protein n=1 Tax=Kineosporia TaxID=49184 RepID=UPI001E5F48F9|nr:ROK family protein [Kineosporia sp. NBRC 101677]MCE0534777.1 ROK family protein [Kineosporia rhizophila]GLY19296.1 glucokinase [Kineosporia sp. NBRC 101677]